MLFLCSERDVFANFGEHLRGDAEERGEVLQGKMLNNTRATLQQQLIAFAGCGAVEVEVAGAVLYQYYFSRISVPSSVNLLAKVVNLID